MATFKFQNVVRQKPHALPLLVFKKQKTKGVFFKSVFNILWAPINTKWLLLKFKLQVKMKQKPSNGIPQLDLECFSSTHSTRKTLKHYSKGKCKIPDYPSIIRHC